MDRASCPRSGDKLPLGCEVDPHSHILGVNISYEAQDNECTPTLRRATILAHQALFNQANCHLTQLRPLA